VCRHRCWATLQFDLRSKVTTEGGDVTSFTNPTSMLALVFVRSRAVWEALPDGL
jgi:hypothetical protein